MVTYMGHKNYCGPNNHIYQLKYVTRNIRIIYQCEICKWATTDPLRDEKKWFEELIMDLKKHD